MTDKDKKYKEDYLMWSYLTAKLSGTYIYNDTEFKMYNKNVEITSAGEIFLTNF